MTDASQTDAWSRLIDELWQANPMSRLVPLSPGEVSKAFQAMWLDALKNPARSWEAYTDFVTQSTRLWTNAALQLWGAAPAASVAVPEAGDKRFNAPDWQRNAAF